MNQINKIFLSSVASLFLAGQAVANQNTFDKLDIEAELAQQLNVAIAQIDTTGVDTTAKTQLDEMTFKQNVERFLSIAKYDEETQSAPLTLIAE